MTMAKYLILDAGHSAKTGGKRNTIANPKFFEYEFNNDIAQKLKARAEAHGIKVHLTNTTPNGADIPLTTRANNASAKYKSRGCSSKDCLFVSIHANAAGSGASWANARGCETYHAGNASQTSKDAALTINTELFNTLKAIDPGFKNRGRKSSNFTVIHKTKCPAILVETAFYDNKEDLKLLQNHRHSIVEGLMKGICKHFGIAYKPVSKPNTTVQQPVVNKQPASSKESFVVKVIVDSLNIRKGPGVDHAVVGSIKKGQAYTIVEVQNGWGRLKSGVGWINISSKYVQKI
jgi:N-acetylmuramoyl-L-alanine amidase